MNDEERQDANFRELLHWCALVMAIVLGAWVLAGVYETNAALRACQLHLPPPAVY